jgi:ketosteroid isomerase-like protein
VSEENVKIVRRAVDAFNARDRDRMLGLMDPEIEFRSVFERKTYRGLAGMVQWREDLDAMMDELHTEDDRFLDAGKDRVVYMYRIVGRGTGSGGPVSRENAILWHLRKRQAPQRRGPSVSEAGPRSRRAVGLEAQREGPKSRDGSNGTVGGAMLDPPRSTSLHKSLFPESSVGKPLVREPVTPLGIVSLGRPPPTGVAFRLDGPGSD